MNERARPNELVYLSIQHKCTVSERPTDLYRQENGREMVREQQMTQEVGRKIQNEEQPLARTNTLLCFRVMINVTEMR